MQWFAALNEDAFQAGRYVELLKVAVHTARTRTRLAPNLLYDGRESALTAWLRARGVRIVRCRSFLRGRLETIARERGDPNLLATGAGALLRIELPRIVRDLGMDDPFVLYTDVDVLFQADVCPALQALTPRHFAAGPEFDRDDSLRMNTGVMLMNVDALRAVDDDFRRFVADRLAQLVDDNWDQGAYRSYFGRPAIAAKLFGPRWDALPPEFNWKPHWGSNDAAAIVHFHGPKPQDQGVLASGAVPSHMQWMTPYATGAYDELVAKWRRALAEAAD